MNPLANEIQGKNDEVPRAAAAKNFFRFYKAGKLCVLTKKEFY
jgi:hypothetical protein